MDPLYETVASTYKLARRLKDNKLAQQMLSLLVVQKELKDCDIREMCSDPGPQPVAGDSVRFRGKLLAANGLHFPDGHSTICAAVICGHWPQCHTCHNDTQPLATVLHMLQ